LEIAGANNTSQLGGPFENKGISIEISRGRGKRRRGRAQRKVVGEIEILNGHVAAVKGGDPLQSVRPVDNGPKPAVGRVNINGGLQLAEEESRLCTEKAKKKKGRHRFVGNEI